MVQGSKLAFQGLHKIIELGCRRAGYALSENTTGKTTKNLLAELDGLVGGLEGNNRSPIRTHQERLPDGHVLHFFSRPVAEVEKSARTMLIAERKDARFGLH